MWKREAVQSRGEEIVSFREVLDAGTRDARREIAAQAWPTWSRERQVAEIARVYSGMRNPTWPFVEACIEYAAEQAIQHIAERKGWKVTIEREGQTVADPVVLAAIRRIKADLGHVERRVAIRKE